MFSTLQGGSPNSVRQSKQTFLCRYLHSEELNREINEGLNVIEQWNGATDFVRFARRGKFVGNVREDQFKGTKTYAICSHF